MELSWKVNIPIDFARYVDVTITKSERTLQQQKLTSIANVKTTSNFDKDVSASSDMSTLLIPELLMALCKNTIWAKTPGANINNYSSNYMDLRKPNILFLFLHCHSIFSELQIYLSLQKTRNSENTVYSIKFDETGNTKIKFSITKLHSIELNHVKRCGLTFY